MIYFAGIAFLIGLGVLVLMRDEIMSGYFRWRDYFLVVPLLALAAFLMVFLAGLLPDEDGFWLLFLLPIRAILTFGLIVFVWGITLTAGALIIRLFTPGPH